MLQEMWSLRLHTERLPQCNICVYCKMDGHLVSNCVRAPPCPICKGKGHPEQFCPQGVVIYTSLRPAKRMRTSPSEQSTDMSISVVSPKHDESRWFAIPKDIREDLSLQETYEFPNLESLCKETIEEIIAGLLPGTGPKEY
ncbi:hypothetical protein BDV41DRAFT_411056 [Aspergillus transmontanensis]|uniref:CCHC-type domain-containing protein n=1 Tax=Aspergillus transmontanensis TaxID=1034304 RepID=A0A5N6WBM2_9EURO|nr:hypothetical protein BDV41DRAFT_411056 [Aspergillus transmontanensis]